MLDGLRVLDFTRILAGPYCAMLMADLGADVIKVERPGRGDDARYLGGKDGMSAVFASVNRSKRSVAIDLAKPEGQRLAFELARRADVILENFLPGGAAKMGLGYDAVRAANPTVVYVSITGFGQTGPYAQRPGYNTIAMGMAGLMALTGSPGHPPTRPGGSLSDLAASFVAFGAVNAALVNRFRTGEGRYLDVSLLASSISLLPDPIAHYFESGRRPGREGNRNPILTPAEAFKTQDGFINVVVMNPDQWQRFCRALGDEAMIDDARFATNAERLVNYALFKARVETALAKAPTAEWVARLAKASIACGPIYEFDEVFADPQVQHLQMVTELDQPGHGRVKMLNFPFRTSGPDAVIRRPAPRLGEHTAEVLNEIGLESAEIDRLVGAGIVA
ncbi:MAG TPA: CoA transferase [Methylomirabilota bacterium]|jgi:crotonobetainyl-CoA:carnitine CoA-transferase CaiB-like acyl-CoA transferase|nr:CoA transferase [Methylomirabilota bacterium]